MGIKNNDTFIQVTLKESSEDDCLNDILNGVVDRLQFSLVTPGSPGIAICRGDVTDTFVEDYCIRENGSGTTVGLFKRINGRLEQVKLAIPGELALIQGSGLSKIDVPVGWTLVEDENLQQKYNIGSSPNWEVALIKYIGA